MRRAVLALLVTVAAPIRAEAADCYRLAAEFYRPMPVNVLRCIAHVESRGRLDAIGVNANGTEDICAMQINSTWLPKLAPYGIDRAALLTDECTCVHSGAWILAHEIKAAGLTWRAVARYHTGPNPTRDPAREERGRAYASKVLACLRG